jgi:hypothetical protein
MTTARQERKLFRTFLASAAVILSLSGSPLDAPIAFAATTERIVVDWHTGLAIGGYDPVAYFTDGKPLIGKEDVELRYAGAVWRFRNIGNREAFATHPDIYMPKFGGYDPIGIAHGVAIAGNPTIWRISGERLFLFFDQERSAAFDADPARAVAAAERAWPDVRASLSP